MSQRTSVGEAENRIGVTKSLEDSRTNTADCMNNLGKLKEHHPVLDIVLPIVAVPFAVIS
jgi:hypothetical protein